MYNIYRPSLVLSNCCVYCLDFFGTTFWGGVACAPDSCIFAVKSGGRNPAGYSSLAFSSRDRHGRAARPRQRRPRTSSTHTSCCTLTVRASNPSRQENPATMSSPASLPVEIYKSAHYGELQKVVKWLRKGGLTDALCSRQVAESWGGQAGNRELGRPGR